MSGSYWSEIKLEVPKEWGELVAEIFEEEGAGGIVYEDPEILTERPLKADEFLSEEAKASVPQRFGLKVYFPVDDRLGERITRIKQRIVELLEYEPQFKLRQVQEEDWAEAWKSYFKPEHIGRVVIKPSWESYQPRTGEIVVELDPGMAFGTGTHPSTRLCLGLLQEQAPGRTSMLDIGTGSGILAVSAAKLGIPQIVAGDIDPLAVKVATENVQRNGVGGQVRVVEGDLLQLGLNTNFELIVANIITNVILKLIPDLPGALAPKGHFLASGIIDERFPEVEAALTEQGFELVKRVSADGWTALVATRSREQKV